MLALAGITGRPGEDFHMALICVLNSTRTNISSEHTAMVARMAGLVPCTSRLMPTMVSLRPSTG
ncbi:hypothetical protein D3C80_1650820 [compost metagenome]